MKTTLLMLTCVAMAPFPASAASSKVKSTATDLKSFTQSGTASWYGNDFRGHKMANGKRYNPDDLTAAHRKLPFGTMVRVTNLRNSRSVVVCITNRGPYIKGRIIDVSNAAARQLDMIHSRTARVRIDMVQ